MYEYRLKGIKSVYDGDTFIGYVDLGFGVVKEEKFRLANIDTPELRGDSLEEARISRDWLRTRLSDALIDNKDIIIKTFKDSKGKYGRYIAEIFINDISINQQMLNEGLAVEYK